jgi:hypothetical protein
MSVKKSMRRRQTSFLGLLLLAATAAVAQAERRVSLLPKLQPGQTLLYLVRYRVGKNVKTESKVAVPMAPTSSQIDARGLLRIEIMDVQQNDGRQAIRARCRFLRPSPGPAAKNSSEQAEHSGLQQKGSPEKSIEFTISPEGSAKKIIGLDDLSSDEQQIWQEWLERFAVAWAIPSPRQKVGEKWKAERLERAASPIAALVWIRDSSYVRNERCHAAQLSPRGDISPLNDLPDTCAVLLTTARLEQKSSPKDATPEEFKLHELKTMGTARGTNEIFTYISLTTGLVVRATEEANQQMDVVVAKADGSNGVHYNVNAKSQTEVLLVTETPLTHP